MIFPPLFYWYWLLFFFLPFLALNSMGWDQCDSLMFFLARAAYQLLYLQRFFIHSIIFAVLGVFFKPTRSCSIADASSTYSTHAKSLLQLHCIRRPIPQLKILLFCTKSRRIIKFSYWVYHKHIIGQCSNKDQNWSSKCVAGNFLLVPISFVRF